MDRKNSRDTYPTTGTEITAKNWLTEAPMRMLMNNLHPDVAELCVRPGQRIHSARR